MPDLTSSDVDPNAPVRREPPNESISLAAIESATAFIEGSPNGEQESETEFGQKFQEAIRKANPVDGRSTTDDETLKAMEKR